MTTTDHKAVRAALDEVRRIKAPTKRAARVAALILELPTQAAVTAFARQLRIDSGSQDIQLLEGTEGSWKVREWTSREETRTSTPALLNTLDGADEVHISWPSVTMHWGISVTFTWGGVKYLATSEGYQLTETYLSA